MPGTTIQSFGSSLLSPLKQFAAVRTWFSLMIDPPHSWTMLNAKSISKQQKVVNNQQSINNPSRSYVT